MKEHDGTLWVKRVPENGSTHWALEIYKESGRWDSLPSRRTTPQGESQIMMKCDLLVAEGELTIGEARALGEDRLWRSLDLIL